MSREFDALVGRPWEFVNGDRDEGDRTERIRVDGGWLYRTLCRDHAVAMCFVPDWRGTLAQFVGELRALGIPLPPLPGDAS